MFKGEQPDQHPVPQPAPVVAVAVVTRQRNEKEVLTRQRAGGRGTGFSPRTVNFNIVDVGEVIAVDPVRDEHGGFTYVGGMAVEKQVRHHETKRNRLSAYLLATKAYVATLETMYEDDAIVKRERVSVAQRVKIATLKGALLTAEDPEIAAQRKEERELAERLATNRLTVEAVGIRDSNQARAEYLPPDHPRRKANIAGAQTTKSTSDGTASEAPPKKEKKKK